MAHAGSECSIVTDPLLSKEQYDNFRDFLEKSCGIVLGDNKHYLVTSRLNRLTHEFSFDSLNSMLDALKHQQDNRLKQRIIDAMTTNETSWFRDIYPFDLLRENLIPEIVQRKPARIRIWSAASSSGQEPYSISMILSEMQIKSPGLLNVPVEIIGTDISNTVLNVARQAEYDNLSISRGISEERKKMFFRQVENDRWQLNDKVKSIVKFSELNLLQNYSLLGKFDLIFCRNVLIYFSSESKSDILQRMAKILNPGGYIILGGSESPTGYCRDFEMIRFPKGVVYRLRSE
ncbi:MAG: protein-glutamate O-methyltransferase CheR [Thioalkalispiraceae bacterium]|jgi:chemotaxis protein methyltransferase CheR